MWSKMTTCSYCSVLISVRVELSPGVVCITLTWDVIGTFVHVSARRNHHHNHSIYLYLHPKRMWTLCKPSHTTQVCIAQVNPTSVHIRQKKSQNKIERRKRSKKTLTIAKAQKGISEQMHRHCRQQQHAKFFQWANHTHICMYHHRQQHALFQ